MKSKKEDPPPQEKPPKKKIRDPRNHWVIQVGGNEPIYFRGNERRAEGRRIYYGVKYNGVSWKRLATEQEAQEHKALARIKPEEVFFSPATEPSNIIKQFFSDATDDQITKARAVAQKVIDKNTKLSKIHQDKIKKWNEELHVKNRQPPKRT